MAWITINASGAKRAAVLSNTIQTTQPSPEASTETASKYRINILNAAEDLVSSRPRKRRCSRILSKAKSPEWNPSPNNSYMCSKHVSNTVRRGKEEASDGLPIVHTHQTSKLHIIGTEKPLHDSRCSRVPDEQLSLRSNYEKQRFEESAQTNSTIFPARKERQPSVIEISSDDSGTIVGDAAQSDSDFESFDDSIFDQAFDSLSRSKDIEITDRSPKPGNRTLYPNGSPLPPFLHPCLLNCLEQAESVINKTGMFIVPLCFRTAEVIRLGKHFIETYHHKDQAIKIEIYATISEVKFADSKGFGQGVIFGDIFFPNKPPYITATSRMPYSATSLKPELNRDPDNKGIVRATVLLSRASAVVSARRSLTASIKTPSFEVLEIHATTWDEVHDVKSMVEKDYNARCGQTPHGATSKQSLLLGKDARNTSPDLANAVVTPSATRSDDNLKFEDDFSDADLSLPDLEDLLRSC